MSATANTAAALDAGSERTPSRRIPEETGSVLVPASARFEGLVTFRGRARVDGEVEGEIVCQGTLWVGPGGRVIGTVEVDELVVEGVVEGEVTARRRLELSDTARVSGAVRTPRLHMADGSQLDGRCETGPAAAE